MSLSAHGVPERFTMGHPCQERMLTRSVPRLKRRPVPRLPDKPNPAHRLDRYAFRAGELRSPDGSDTGHVLVLPIVYWTQIGGLSCVKDLGQVLGLIRPLRLPRLGGR
jgi:hypothetical protein